MHARQPNISACIVLGIFYILPSCQPPDPNTLIGTESAKLCSAIFVDVDEDAAATIEASVFDNDCKFDSPIWS